MRIMMNAPVNARAIQAVGKAASIGEKNETPPGERPNPGRIFPAGRTVTAFSEKIVDLTLRIYPRFRRWHGAGFLTFEADVEFRIT